MAFDSARDIERGNRRYIAAVMQAPILEREYEFDLARRWRYHQDEDALHELIQAYARFVVRIAWKFRGYGLPVGDLMQEGNIGIMEAAARFDPERNARFSTYASWWIVAAIQDYILRHSSVVRLATTPAQRRLFFNLRRLRAKLATSQDGTLTEADREAIATLLEVKPADVARMEAHLSGPDASLNLSIGEDDSSELMDLVADDRPTPEDTATDVFDTQVRSRWLGEALDTLNSRERQIIVSRFLKDEKSTLAEIGERFGVSKERIRQIEAKALDKLRTALDHKAVPGDFFGAPN